MAAARYAAQGVELPGVAADLPGDGLAEEEKVAPPAVMAVVTPANGSQVSEPAGVTRTRDPPPRAQRVEDVDVDGTLVYYLQHPTLRIFVSVAITFANFFLNAEDPIAHSVVQSRVPVVGGAFSLLFTKWPASAAAVVVKLVCAAAGVAAGCVVGRRYIHHTVLRDRWQLRMFANDQGTWMVMFFTSIVACASVGAGVYNVALGFLVDDPEDDGLVIDGTLGLEERTFGRLAHTGTFLGDLITALMVIDLILQRDDLYPHWQPWLRRRWKSNAVRMGAFWGALVILLSAVIPIIMTAGRDSQLSRWWDDFNYDFLPTTEYSRGVVAACVTVCDLVIVMQDWEFPLFETHVGISLPGLSVSAIDLPRLHVTITGKWLQYGIIFLVMLFDLNMLKNQLLYDPDNYGQYVGGDGHIYTVRDRAWLDAHPGPVDPALRAGMDDPVMASRFEETTWAWKVVAVTPALFSVGVFLFLIKTYRPAESAVWRRRSEASRRRMSELVGGGSGGRVSRRASTAIPIPEPAVLAPSPKKARKPRPEPSTQTIRLPSTGQSVQCVVVPLADSESDKEDWDSGDDGTETAMTLIAPGTLAAGSVGVDPRPGSRGSSNGSGSKPGTPTSNVLVMDRGRGGRGGRRARPTGLSEAVLGALRPDEDSLQFAQAAEEEELMQAAGEAPELTRWEMMRWVIYVLFEDPLSSKASAVMHAWFALVVMMSVFSLLLQSMDPDEYPSVPPQESFTTLELFFSALFVTEFLLRLVVADTIWHENPSSNARPFLRDPLNWMDFLAVVPYFAAWAGMEGDAVSLLRVLRVFKVMRNYRGWKVILRAASLSLRPLLVPMFFLFVVAMIFATAIYYVEPCDSEDLAECAFTDVFNAGYFVVVTMTSVGYGDQVPFTTAGKSVALLCMIFGTGFLAMQVAIIGHNFEMAWQEDQQAMMLLEQQKAPPPAPPEELRTGTGEEDEDEASDATSISVQPSRSPAEQRLELVPVAVAAHLRVAKQLHHLADIASGAVRSVDALLTREIQRLRDDHAVLQARVNRLRAPYFRRRELAKGELIREPHWRALTVSQSELARITAAGAFDMADVENAILRNSWRDRLWLMLEVPGSSRGADVMSRLLMVTVLGSLMAFCCQTVPELEAAHATFEKVQTGFVLLFTVELMLRLWLAPSIHRFLGDRTNWFDAAAVIPHYLTAMGFSAEVWQSLAVLRVFKMLRHYKGSGVLLEAAQLTARKLLIPLAVFAVFTVIFASWMWLAERGNLCAEADGSLSSSSLGDDDDGCIDGFRDIVSTAWVVVVTMTTVGYGYFAPAMPMGKLVALFAMLFGTFYVAMPLTIVGNIYLELFQRDQERLAVENCNMELVMALESSESSNVSYARRRENLHNLFAYFSGGASKISSIGAREVMVFTRDIAKDEDVSALQLSAFVQRVSGGRSFLRELDFVRYLLYKVAPRFNPELLRKGAGEVRSAWDAFDRYLDKEVDRACSTPLLDMSQREESIWEDYEDGTKRLLERLRNVATTRDLLPVVREFKVLQFSLDVLICQSLFPVMQELTGRAQDIKSAAAASSSGVSSS